MATFKSPGIINPDLILRTFSFTPSAGPVGTQVTLSGNALNTPVSQVLFNGVAASRQVVGNSIVAIVPNGATDGPITLVFADSSSVSSLSNFDVTSGIANPMITSFFPTSGQAGSLVQLNGSGFTGATAVKFNGVPAQFNPQADTNIIAWVPQGATDGLISVERLNSNGTVSTGFSQTPFDVTTNTLSINGFNPMSGVSGQEVMISGNGFIGVDTVLFGDLAAFFAVFDDASIKAFAPAGLPGQQVTITVKKGSSSANSGNLRFTYADNSSLSVSGFLPASGPAGTPVQVMGSGFIGVQNVKIGNAFMAFSVQSDSQLTAWIPDGAQDGRISVIEGTVTAISAATFDVTNEAAFNISGINPASGVPGTSVVISGSGFTGASAVLFGNLSTSFTVNTDNKITAIAPNGAPGSIVPVIVRKGAQQVASTPLTYTYPGSGGGGTLPMITSFLPNPASAGSTVRVLGSGFTGTTMVKIGLVQCSFQIRSNTELLITVPDFAFSGRVSVTNAAGTGTSRAVLQIV